MSDEEDSEYKNKGKLLNYFAELTKNESREDLQNTGIGFAAVVMTCAVLFVAANDPKAMTEQFYLYCVFGILPAMIGVFLAAKLFSGPTDINKLYFYGGILFVFIVSMYMFYRTMNPSSVQTVSYALGGLSFLIMILGLAIVYRIFVRTIINTRGWLGFFLKFLFLIPCLVIDLLETVFVELKNTPKMIIVLFILEILIILAYIYIPRVSKPSTNSVVLLDKPLFLTNIQSIGKTNQLFMDANEIDNPSKAADTIRQNYSISMWIYINQHSNTFAAYSKETNVFRYGYPNSAIGHPRVAYFNDVNDPNKSDKLIVYVNDNDSTKDSSGIRLDMLPQSWNQVIISYNESVVDIFINGDLVKSKPLSHDARPEYNVGDVLEVGEGNNTFIRGGLHGSICNVVYYKSPLTLFQVSNDYNLNRYRNPPTHS
jgi:hypothetical protein